MKYKIDIAPLADYYVVVVKDKETDELKDTFTLNESAADMMRFFCQGMDAKRVSEEMARLYEAPIEIITKDVNAFFEKMNWSF